VIRSAEEEEFMHRYATALLTTTILILGANAPAAAQQGTPAKDEAMTAVAAHSLSFNDIAVPGFDPGLKMAVLSGSPDATGPYTLRLSFPDGYKFPPHWHPNAEHVTVLSGSFQLAMGERAEPSTLKTYEPGDYLFIPAKHPHFGAVSGTTVIQLHGDGPFTINVIGGTSQ
jgi:quercetin dioxygenase-like cupin family protein